MHDMYFACPSIFFRFNNKDYCGAAEDTFSDALCQKCSFGSELETHRSYFSKLFQLADKIIYPSNLIENVLNKYYAEDVTGNLLFKEHQSFSQRNEIPVKTRQNKLNLAYLGYESPLKGWDVFKKLANQQALQAQYNFYHLGGKEDAKNDAIKVRTYSFQQDGVHAATDCLLKNDIDLVVLWSLIPESYSYTLHEAYAAGIPVITHKNSGNIAYKIKQGDIYGLVLNSEDELLEFLSSSEKVASFLASNTNTHSLNIHTTFVD